MIRLVAKWMVLVVVALAGSAACTATGDAELLCEPGENIFCRCRAGEAGTKQCRGDGRGFDQCIGLGGVCEESFGTPGSDDPEPSGPSGLKPLLEPCATSGECDSGLCSMGYCTLECGTWQECSDDDAGVYGDCVNVGPLQQCVPYCGDQSDCESFGGISGCGYVQAVDALGVNVCADFDPVPLPPEGSDCYDDYGCHLGIAGVQRVCEFGMCIGGCHASDDCPDGSTCNPGAPGLCVPSS